MAYYECVLIARQDVPSAQVEGLTSTFTGVISDNGGTVTKTEYWGLKTLAYRIKKNRKGHYVLMNIDAPYPAVAEMERRMRLHEDVLRHLTIRVDALEEGQSIMMQNRASRDGGRGDRRDRGDRGDRDRDRDRGDRGDRDRGDRDRRDREPRADASGGADAPAEAQTQAPSQAGDE